ncbi:MAG: hypothetical protein JWM86_2214 [Thermoleophilia bacterium]|nr:hypothetical protein [Thermoleophilia bacterium]
MPHRHHRSPAASVRAQRMDLLVLPAVTLMLLIGAGFVASAWRDAGDATRISRTSDERRASQVADSISRIVRARQLELRVWVSLNTTVVQVGHERELGWLLQQRVTSDGPASAAWIVVREDGTFAGIGEQDPGRIAASGIADELRTLGRTTARQGTPKVSGRLLLGDQVLFGVAYSIPASTDTPASAVLRIAYFDFSAIGYLLADDAAGKSADPMALVDARDRIIGGSNNVAEQERIRRAIGTTGWVVESNYHELRPFLPQWAYPGFSLLLVACALAFALQELTRRRLRVVGEERAAQVHGLYELAERMLRAQTIEQQATDLADSMIWLAGVDGATVTVDSHDERIEHGIGASGRGLTKLRVPISGPREAFGELVVSRADGSMLEEDQWVVQTAATLAGAAMHTLVSLGTERAAAAELQRLDELRSNLLATVAHELLSPLTAVKGVLGLLSMQDDLGQRGHKYVEVATERTDRLVALIRDLFDCSLLETGQLDIKPRRQRADELLDAALGAQAAARAGELRLSASPNLMITVDPIRFDQLVNNLVTNAFRHGAPPVEVAVRPGDGGVVVVVSDEGPGIPEADRAEIFGKFWQASTGHARMSEGAGLGLSLVQGLVRVHGGEISVDSARPDGRGARFTAFFPDEVPGHPVASPPAEPEELPSGSDELASFG